jgi:muramoyltetrapeptide carboxypeptidase
MPTDRPLRVGVVAPSSPYQEDRLSLGLEKLRGAGFEIVDDEALLPGAHAYLNGSDDQRLHALRTLYTRAHCDVLWLARGGYGLTRLLPRLEADPLLDRDPPLLVGFSDGTALFSHLIKSHGRPSLHGPLATSVADADAAVMDALLQILGGNARGVAYPLLRALGSASAGPIEGPGVGGNLCVFGHLIGTPSMPDLKGAILFLEEVGERPYRIDRMLTHLAAAGALDGLRACVVGHLTGCEEAANPKATRKAPNGLDVFRDRFLEWGIPLFSGLPFGHEAPNLPIPLGVPLRIEHLDHAGERRARLRITHEICAPEPGVEATA